ncbi:hypothetical protein BGZ73_000854 [Actinomortierella ambigua]|nr:hypothetical protein BGZ73_000854 [Actinomortierella ambigua]
MDVCRMTQAYRQQHPGVRQANNKRTNSSPNSGLAVASSSPSSVEGSHVPVASHHHRDQQNSPPASPTGFSIASMLPESLASVLSSSPASTRAPVAASSLLPGLNMGELEAQSLLLRSMPMFGSLISRD